ncbi:MAG: hypothetical protein ACYDAK_12460 [Candidatus Limnocylindrales bacterium]
MREAALRVALAVRDAGDLGHLGIHDRLGQDPDALEQDVDVAPGETFAVSQLGFWLGGSLSTGFREVAERVAGMALIARRDPPCRAPQQPSRPQAPSIASGSLGPIGFAGSIVVRRASSATSSALRDIVGIR